MEPQAVWISATEIRQNDESPTSNVTTLSSGSQLVITYQFGVVVAESMRLISAI